MPDLREQLHTGLAGLYHLDREVGRGGMATVFLAQDLRHDRPVALKVLHPELAVSLGLERFQREIRLAARLQHPHILTVHDSGNIAGQLWYTMPFVEGESLRDRLRRERQLPISDALKITREVADALGYAHRHGIVHRDIKPENILLSEGHALVADFGVARALQSAGGEQLTQTGASVGTPAYMSPEQAMGDSSLDCRSDLYSLGCVLYEMLTGEPPYTGPSTQAITAKRLMDPVPSARRLRETVPPALDQALQRVLAKTPADRFATAADFTQAFADRAPHIPESTEVAPIRKATALSSRWRGSPRLFAFTGVVMVAVVVGVAVWQRSHRNSASASDSALAFGPKRVAVLPFENLGDSADAYFADGVTDAVRDKLTAIPGLEVIASTSSAEYRHTRKPPQQIGQELGVRYVLIGKVRWAKGPGQANRVQVRPELIETSSAAQRWGEAFDATMTDVFEVQGRIASEVARELNVALGQSERQTLAEKPTVNLAAYDAYLKGQEISQAMSTVDPVALRRAAAMYEQAIALDTTFALAWAQLARARSESYWAAVPTPALAEAARRAAQRALTLAPIRAEGHLALGMYYYRVVRDNAKALAEFIRGQQLSSTSADLLTATAVAEQSLGHWDSALAHFQRAQALDPRSVLTMQRLGSALLCLRRYSEAHTAFDHGLAIAPTNMDLIRAKTLVYLAEGDLSSAQRLIKAVSHEVDSTTVLRYMASFGFTSWLLSDAQQQHLFRLTPAAFDNDGIAWGVALAKTYALRGDSAKARLYADSVHVWLTEGLKTTPNDAPGHALHGLALAYLGRKSDAIREGERAVALLPIAKDALDGAWVLAYLVDVYVVTGENDRALDAIERLLNVPSYLSSGWLRIDPTFAPLRGDPRFERLANGQ